MIGVVVGAAADVVVVCCAVVVTIMFGSVVAGSNVSARVVASSWIELGELDVACSGVVVKIGVNVVGTSDSGSVSNRRAVVCSSVEETTLGVVIDSVDDVVIGSVLAADVTTGVVVCSGVVVSSGVVDVVEVDVVVGWVAGSSPIKIWSL